MTVLSRALLGALLVLALRDAQAQQPTPPRPPERLRYGVHLVPADILNLTNWKQTIPIGPAEKPTEIRQPQLATYELNPYFIVEPGVPAVRFRAPTSAVTTSGSNYPRSELREMIDNGMANASWSTSSGTHIMEIEQAITAVPETKKHVVAGQIHDANDDVIVIRLELPKLFVDINGTDGPVLDANYQLGRKFKVKFEAGGGKVKIFYNDGATPAYILTQAVSGCYFKAGAYVQSNCTKEVRCAEDNYGEVQIYNLSVTHS